MTTPLERYQLEIDKAKTDIIAQTSLKTWNNYLGSRSMAGQLHEGNSNATSLSSAECPCCARVRENLVSHAISGKSLIWLVDVRLLHAAVSLKYDGTPKSKQCAFCPIIYQQFWAWQTPKYRLLSQLCANEILAVDASDEAVPFTHLIAIWNKSVGLINRHPNACFQEKTGANDSDNCERSTCGFCHPDKNAREPFPEFQSLCEPCRKIIEEQSGEASTRFRLSPIIPLLLSPTIDNTRESMSVLRVLHPTTRANSGMTREWIWFMYSLPDDKASTYIPSFVRASYDDERVFEQIRAWMRDCANHSTCQLRRPLTSTLPSRVLDVRNNLCVLQDSPNMTGRYVALSYCWGAPQPDKLTAANVESYKQRIAVETLPSTIQQAIKVTRAIGVDYLWIDSMCIVQDDEEDKFRELAKMCEIYSNSTLTLCASAARWCTEGFFNLAALPGTSYRMPDVGIVYPCALPDGSTGSVRLIERIDYRPGAEALTSRGWTFQEHFLPTSVVQFGACLSWECDELCRRKTLSSLTGGIDSRLPFSALFQREDESQFQLRKAFHGLTDSHLSEPGTSQDCTESDHSDRSSCPATDLHADPAIMISTCTCEDGKFYSIWQQAVGYYSRRRLSEPTDKLPAFAGFVEACARSRKDEYLAGLWRRRVVHDLMWRSKGPSDRKRPPWRAPSWSWACLDAGIDIIGAHRRVLENPFDHLKTVSQTEKVQVEACKVELLNEQNPFGQIKSAYIEINGRLIKTKLLRTDYGTKIRIEGASIMSLARTSFEKISSPDDFARPVLDLFVGESPDLEGHGSEQEGWDIWCLQVREEVVLSKSILPGRTQPEMVTLMDGLILLPTNETMREFRRIGVWVTDWRVVVEAEQHPFREVQPRRIRLV